jgi:hypothetical protein
MTTERYVLPNGGELIVSWEKGWKNTTVQVEGQTVASINKKKELTAGRRVQLVEDGIVLVQLIESKLFPTLSKLQLLCDGKALPGSKTENEVRFKDAFGCVFLIAAITILVGILMLGDSPQQGYITVSTGIIYLVLGYFVRRMSGLALIIMIGVYIIDGLAAVFSLIGEGSPASIIIGLVFLKALAFPLLIPGVSAIQALKRQSA